MLLCVIFQTLTQTIERIPTISTQLKIVATVKATMIGAEGNLDSPCMNFFVIWRWNDTESARLAWKTFPRDIFFDFEQWYREA